MRDDVSLLIAGESSWQAGKHPKKKRFLQLFSRRLRAWFVSRKEDEGNYHPLEMIDMLGIRDCVTVVNEFVPNEEVHKYFQVSDAIVLFYETGATASGVESIAYNFRIPILATRVGHFPETVKDTVTGYLSDPDDVMSMTETMQAVIEQPPLPENLEKVAKTMNWANYARSVCNIASSVRI
jgi:glycosyltransferase involved in cell wall biosynthesis